MPKKIEISREELYQKYIVENLTRKDVACFFNVKESLIKSKIKQYNFVKTKEQKSETMSKIQKVCLDRNILYEKYIEQNLSLLECAKELKQSPSVIKRRLRDYGIKKTGDKFKEIHRKYANQTEFSKEKRQKTVLKKYGVSNVSKLNDIKNKKGQTTKVHYGVNNPFQSEDIKKRISKEVMNKYGVPYACMREECRKYSGNNSEPNRKFANLLDKFNIKYEREFALKNFSYDFKVGNILFEINPTIFHNSTFAPFGQPKSKSYHYTKHCVAKEFGFRCIHIFDWDDPEKIIKTFLVNKERVFARKCQIKDVSVKDAKEFIEQNHLQGYAKDSVRIGLFYNGTLVEIMTLAKPRYTDKYDYEIVRLCSNKNVIGGTEKLLSYFIKTYKPRNILSYCDLAKFDGKIYRQLGFTVANRVQPSKHWYNLQTGQHITDNLLRQKGFDQLFKTHYGKGTSNEELMKMAGFVEVYDCGQVAYIKN